jgi:hypothetical protein
MPREEKRGFDGNKEPTKYDILEMTQPKMGKQ